MNDVLNPFAAPGGAGGGPGPSKARWFLFVDWQGRLIPYNDKHAILFGKAMREYLGFVESDDPALFDKTVEEIRAMKLPRDVMPVDARKTFIGPNGEVPYKGKGDIGRILGK